MAKPRISTRDPEVLLRTFGDWLALEVEATSGVSITSLGGPSGAGLSSDTLLLDLAWETTTGPVERAVVLRLPPPDDALPVFEAYDLGRQVESMRVVRAGSRAPVPEILWFHPDPDAIGVPFFVMERIAGIVPPDILPYTWGSWVTELDATDLGRMTVESVDALVSIHSVAPSTILMDAATNEAEGATMLQRHAAKVRGHFDWAAQGRSYPIVEHAWETLRSTFPEVDRPDVLVWGDARIGNILWREARAVAILDWEMTTVGPRELDVAWLIYFAEYFQMSAEGRGLVGVPDLLPRDVVIQRYERATGVELLHLDWFLLLTALHQTSIGIRTTDRAIAFGEYPPEAAEESALHSISQLQIRLDAFERH